MTKIKSGPIFNHESRSKISALINVIKSIDLNLWQHLIAHGFANFDEAQLPSLLRLPVPVSDLLPHHSQSSSVTSTLLTWLASCLLDCCVDWVNSLDNDLDTNDQVTTNQAGIQSKTSPPYQLSSFWTAVECMLSHLSHIATSTNRLEDKSTLRLIDLVRQSARSNLLFSPKTTHKLVRLGAHYINRLILTACSNWSQLVKSCLNCLAYLLPTRSDLDSLLVALRINEKASTLQTGGHLDFVDELCSLLDLNSTSGHCDVDKGMRECVDPADSPLHLTFNLRLVLRLFQLDPERYFIIESNWLAPLMLCANRLHNAYIKLGDIDPISPLGQLHSSSIGALIDELLSILTNPTHPSGLHSASLYILSLVLTGDDVMNDSNDTSNFHNRNRHPVPLTSTQFGTIVKTFLHSWRSWSFSTSEESPPSTSLQPIHLLTIWHSDSTSTTGNSLEALSTITHDSSDWSVELLICPSDSSSSTKSSATPTFKVKVTIGSSQSNLCHRQVTEMRQAIAKLPYYLDCDFDNTSDVDLPKWHHILLRLTASPESVDGDGGESELVELVCSIDGWIASKRIIQLLPVDCISSDNQHNSLTSNGTESPSINLRFGHVVDPVLLPISSESHEVSFGIGSVFLFAGSKTSPNPISTITTGGQGLDPLAISLALLGPNWSGSFDATQRNLPAVDCWWFRQHLTRLSTTPGDRSAVSMQRQLTEMMMDQSNWQLWAREFVRDHLFAKIVPLVLPPASVPVMHCFYRWPDIITRSDKRSILNAFNDLGSSSSIDSVSIGTGQQPILVESPNRGSNAYQSPVVFRFAPLQLPQFHVDYPPIDQLESFAAKPEELKRLFDNEAGSSTINPCQIQATTSECLLLDSVLQPHGGVDVLLFLLGELLSNQRHSTATELDISQVGIDAMDMLLTALRCSPSLADQFNLSISPCLTEEVRPDPLRSIHLGRGHCLLARLLTQLPRFARLMTSRWVIDLLVDHMFVALPNTHHRTQCVDSSRPVPYWLLTDPRLFFTLLHFGPPELWSTSRHCNNDSRELGLLPLALNRLTTSIRLNLVAIDRFRLVTTALTAFQRHFIKPGLFDRHQHHSCQSTLNVLVRLTVARLLCDDDTGSSINQQTGAELARWLSRRSTYLLDIVGSNQRLTHTNSQSNNTLDKNRKTGDAYCCHPNEDLWRTRFERVAQLQQERRKQQPHPPSRLRRSSHSIDRIRSQGETTLYHRSPSLPNLTAYLQNHHCHCKTDCPKNLVNSPSCCLNLATGDYSINDTRKSASTDADLEFCILNSKKKLISSYNMVTVFILITTSFLRAFQADNQTSTPATQHHHSLQQLFALCLLRCLDFAWQSLLDTLLSITNRDQISSDCLDNLIDRLTFRVETSRFVIVGEENDAFVSRQEERIEESPITINTTPPSREMLVKRLTHLRPRSWLIATLIGHRLAEVREIALTAYTVWSVLQANLANQPINDVSLSPSESTKAINYRVVDDRIPSLRVFSNLLVDRLMMATSRCDVLCTKSLSVQSSDEIVWRAFLLALHVFHSLHPSGSWSIWSVDSLFSSSQKVAPIEQIERLFVAPSSIVDPTQSSAPNPPSDQSATDHQWIGALAMPVLLAAIGSTCLDAVNRMSTTTRLPTLFNTNQVLPNAFEALTRMLSCGGQVSTPILQAACDTGLSCFLVSCARLLETVRIDGLVDGDLAKHLMASLTRLIGRVSIRLDQLEAPSSNSPLVVNLIDRLTVITPIRRQEFETSPTIGPNQQARVGRCLVRRALYALLSQQIDCFVSTLASVCDASQSKRCLQQTKQSYQLLKSLTDRLGWTLNRIADVLTFEVPFRTNLRDDDVSKTHFNKQLVGLELSIEQAILLFLLNSASRLQELEVTIRATHEQAVVALVTKVSTNLSKCLTRFLIDRFLAVPLETPLSIVGDRLLTFALRLCNEEWSTVVGMFDRLPAMNYQQFTFRVHRCQQHLSETPPPARVDSDQTSSANTTLDSSSLLDALHALTKPDTRLGIGDGTVNSDQSTASSFPLIGRLISPSSPISRQLRQAGSQYDRLVKQFTRLRDQWWTNRQSDAAISPSSKQKVVSDKDKPKRPSRTGHSWHSPTRLANRLKAECQSSIQLYQQVEQQRVDLIGPLSIVLWRRLACQLDHSSTVLFHHPESSPLGWFVDPVEGPMRQRCRQVRGHLPLADRFVKPEARQSLSHHRLLHPLADLIARPVIDRSRFGARAYVDTEPTSSPIDWPVPFFLLQHSLLPTQQRVANWKCRLVGDGHPITSSRPVNGLVYLSTHCLSFQPQAETTESSSAEDIGSPSRSSLNHSSPHWYWWCVWPLAWIDRVEERRFKLLDTGAELFALPSTAIPPTLMVFVSKKHRDTFLDTISLACQKAKTSPTSSNLKQHSTNMLFGRLRAAKKAWLAGQLTNYAYLMQLNSGAGRTYNDLMQYPLMPWIIRDYTNSPLDLGHPSSYRSLDRPIGVQFEGRAKAVSQRFDQLTESSEPTLSSLSLNCHYPSHCSNEAIVTHFLLRQLPITIRHLKLQDHKFDITNRQFASMATAWELATTMTGCVKELTPEFYSYQPSLFLNTAGLDLGCCQASQTTNDNVELPAWSKHDHRLFTLICRAALERDYATATLSQWIDLVFGYKQHGQEAERALNLYHPYTYYGAIEVATISDPLQAECVRSMIDTYGQSPRQLLRQHPHPMRYSTLTLNLHDDSDLTSASGDPVTDFEEDDESFSSDELFFNSDTVSWQGDKTPLETVIGLRWGCYAGSPHAEQLRLIDHASLSINHHRHLTGLQLGIFCRLTQNSVNSTLDLLDQSGVNAYILPPRQSTGTASGESTSGTLLDFTDWDWCLLSTCSVGHNTHYHYYEPSISWLAYHRRQLSDNDLDLESRQCCTVKLRPSESSSDQLTMDVFAAAEDCIGQPSDVLLDSYSLDLPPFVSSGVTCFAIYQGLPGQVRLVVANSLGGLFIRCIPIDLGEIGTDGWNVWPFNIEDSSASQPESWQFTGWYSLLGHAPNCITNLAVSTRLHSRLASCDSLGRIALWDLDRLTLVNWIDIESLTSDDEGVFIDSLCFSPSLGELAVGRWIDSSVGDSASSYHHTCQVSIYDSSGRRLLSRLVNFLTEIGSTSTTRMGDDLVVGDGQRPRLPMTYSCLPEGRGVNCLVIGGPGGRLLWLNSWTLDTVKSMLLPVDRPELCRIACLTFGPNPLPHTKGFGQSPPRSSNSPIYSHHLTELTCQSLFVVDTSNRLYCLALPLPETDQRLPWRRRRKRKSRRHSTRHRSRRTQSSTPKMHHERRQQSLQWPLLIL